MNPPIDGKIKRAKSAHFFTTGSMLSMSLGLNTVFQKNIYIFL